MTKYLKKQVAGRREGDTEERWVWDIGKILLAVAIPLLISWMTWTTICNFKALENKETLNQQITVIHNRITDEQRQRQAFDQRIMERMLDNR